jgi:hypothetical protein|tara:strand:+ start:56 stop:427 length:372 start_codon:yes stop_codon:yes gene_type:complete
MKKSQIKQSEVKTQIDKVLWHLQTYGTLTTWEAFNTYRIMRLGSIIDILRNKQNYHIETELIGHTLASDSLFPNARNGKGQHAKYLYKEPHNDSFGVPAFVKSTSVEKETTKSFLDNLFSIRK